MPSVCVSVRGCRAGRPQSGERGSGLHYPGLGVRCHSLNEFGHSRARTGFCRNDSAAVDEPSLGISIQAHITDTSRSHQRS